MRNAVARRATVEITDTFEKGLAAWGDSARSWAPGWTRHPDGFVRPGQLAIFRPTLQYTDYRMEFFGQIEAKGLSWVVRARDYQNYYAMKFNVVEPGLRPVIALVRYPVQGGRRGSKVEVPLSVMVHNNTAYHVVVQVRGNHFSTSIEGQEVDSWSDDAPPSGGVGFFSDAGERARLYWMRVAKNDDWMGRICAFLSGNSEEESPMLAWLGPWRSPAPTPSSPAGPQEIALAVEDGEYAFAGLRARSASQERIQICSS